MNKYTLVYRCLTKAAFLYVHGMSTHKFNNAVNHTYEAQLITDGTSVEHTRLLAWITEWAKHNTDRDPVSGKPHLQEYLTYKALWSIYCEG